MENLFKLFLFLTMFFASFSYSMDPPVRSQESKTKECIICYDKQQTLLECLHCHQSLCKVCAEKWIGVTFTYTTNYQNPNRFHEWNAVNNSCPYCRQPITQEQLQKMVEDSIRGESTTNPIAIEFGEETKWAAFSPDGSLILTISKHASAVLWDAIKLTELCNLQEDAVCYNVNAAVFSPDGSLIAFGGSGDISIYSVSEKKVLYKLKKNAGIVTSIHWSHDGARIVAGSRENTTYVWDASNGNLLHTLLAPKGKSGRIEACFSPDGTLIMTRMFFSCGDPFAVRVWDSENGNLLHELKGVDIGAWFAEFRPDSKAILTGGEWSKDAFLWDTRSGAPLHTFKEPRINSAIFSPEGRAIIVSPNDTTLKVLDANDGALLHTWAGHTGCIDSIAFSHDGTRIVTGSNRGMVIAWDINKGTCLFRLESPKGYMINTAIFNPAGTAILTCSDCGNNKMWSLLPDESLHPQAPILPTKLE